MAGLTEKQERKFCKDFELSPEQLESFTSLTRLQRGVAIATLEGLTPAQAHKRAGGVSKSEDNRTRLAGEILRNPAVEKFLDSMKNLTVERLGAAVMSRDEMAERLTQVARTRIDDIMVLSNDTLLNTEGELVQQGAWAFKNPEEMGGYGAGMISELTVGKMGTKIKMHDQVAAMKQLSTLLGYDKPAQVELSGGVSVDLSITAADVQAFRKAFDAEY